MTTYLEDLEVIKKAYVEAIHFTEDWHVEHEGGIRPETVLSHEASMQIEDLCADAYFFAMSEFGLFVNEEFRIVDLSQFGHDLWLTQNGHGSGFWDGDWDDEFGNVMTSYAHSVGELYPYDENGIMYLEGKSV